MVDPGNGGPEPLTLLLADFECFVSYYSRFCAFCVRYGFSSSYYHI